MRWNPAQKEDIQAVITYLKEYEPLCVSLISKLMKKGKPAFFPFSSGKLYVQHGERDDSIDGVFFLTRGGVIYPMLSLKGSDPAEKEVKKLLSRWRNSVVSIIGEQRGVEILSHCIDRNPVHILDYDLLVYEGSKINIQHLPQDFRIRKAVQGDAELIFPLQVAYEKEEVLIHPEEFNGRISFLNLKQSLQTEVIYLLERDGIPIAKAGTNAWGLSFAQIGGVFTIPPFRNQGYGKITVSALINELKEMGFNACLFVMKQNERAQGLYRSVGFTRIADFRIQYYQT